MPDEALQHDEREREQQYVSMLYDRLDSLRDYAATRLRKVLLETGGTPQARSERESFSLMYTEDIAKYDAAENGLCFGRIDLDGQDPDEEAPDGDARRYIGRVGILDEANDYETLLLDWRAPLARPFYLATPAAPEGVTRRRHIRTRSRKVTGLGDEYLDLATAERAGALDGADGVAGESALLTALNAARTGHMNDIVETIQSEQDAIIRSEHKSVMVVQGGPGTGKTAVALHRAAYLLYTYRQQLAKSGVLIIGPNDTFLDYIGQVLPSLGETGVLLSTIGDLYPGVRATHQDSLECGEVKGSLAMVEVLKQAVRDRQETPQEPIRLRFDSYPISLDRKVVTRARGRARSSRRPHNLARPIFVSAVIEALADQHAARIGSNVLGGANLLSRDDIADIRDEMRGDPEVMAAIDGLWPQLTPQRVLADLLGSRKRLDSAARQLTAEQRELLHRTGVAGFSAADAPLLDELAELLGVDDAAERERADREWRAQIADAQGALDILTGSAPQDLEDELDPEILMAYDLIDAGQLAQRQDLRQSQTAAERAAADRTWTYGHVIVDEAQELSEMAWRMLMRRIPNRWMTLVGDTAQTGDPAGSSSWQTVLEPYVARRWKLTELTVNYRTPSEIMDVAQDVLARIDPDQTVPRSVRDSGTRPWARRVPEGEVAEQVRRMVAAETGPGLVAVLTSESGVDEFLDLISDSVSVLSVRQAKGLEFDSVLIVEPRQIVDESPRGMNDLYVALTRATQRLGVVHAHPLPDGLSKLSALE
ncbi:DNA helicase IV [Rhodococcus sp. PvR044]|uniref:HelD family protein n=1 Tax=unclassified Rhodococcus (in: high G+C Gram-positive bacteria) TaxID=192944 RepID=UPI000BCC3A98|nr:MULTISPECIES: ATP-binding domain-containing protein [unclassified Rhodococcus (in: high G+C Gram-positive bacteria)]MBP1159062.1 DNA helicase IV [Rhodococcus sp. PvR099]PTR39065.1 DNA helicase IV [Rhodococcus sp. OK611]SNX92851.1 DNA helicase IV [Rhodococcus sp. OK270]